MPFEVVLGGMYILTSRLSLKIMYDYRDDHSAFINYVNTVQGRNGIKVS